MLRVHVRLDLENEGGESLRGRLDGFARAPAWQRRRRKLKEAIEKELDAEVVRGRSEEHRGESAGQNLVHVEVRARAFQEIQLLADLRIGDLVHRVFHPLVLDAGHVHRRTESTVGGALEEMDLAVFPVVNALETRPVAERPVHRKRVDAEHGFQLVE